MRYLIGIVILVFLFITSGISNTAFAQAGGCGYNAACGTGVGYCSCQLSCPSGYYSSWGWSCYNPSSGSGPCNGATCIPNPTPTPTSPPAPVYYSDPNPPAYNPPAAAPTATPVPQSPANTPTPTPAPAGSTPTPTLAPGQPTPTSVPGIPTTRFCNQSCGLSNQVCQSGLYCAPIDSQGNKACRLQAYQDRSDCTVPAASIGSASSPTATPIVAVAGASTSTLASSSDNQQDAVLSSTSSQEEVLGATDEVSTIQQNQGLFSSISSPGSLVAIGIALLGGSGALFYFSRKYPLL